MHLDCLFVPCYGSLRGVGCPQARWRRQRSKGSCDGRLFEATEIATMDDEMLMEETLDNLGWTSTQVLHMEAFDMSLPMYGSTAQCSSAPSP